MRPQKQQATGPGLDQIRQRCPFGWRDIRSDNHSGLINHLLWRYCRAGCIRMSRSRPCQKNDNAWVEQKNWTHVRKVVAQLRETYESLNPVALDRQLESLRRELFELADAKLPVILRRRQRGPDIALGRRQARVRSAAHKARALDGSGPFRKNSLPDMRERGPMQRQKPSGLPLVGPKNIHLRPVYVSTHGYILK
jgi:hypothetical protein